MPSVPTFFATIKEKDPDRYRSALFAASKARDDLVCFYAFHAELAKIPEIVSEPMIGAIRYQWWRDAVEEIYGGTKVRAHEVSTPLSAVLSGAGISRFWIDQLIDARERDLDPAPFENIEAAKLYCTQTSSKLMQIAVSVAAPQIDLSDDYVKGVEAAGLAWGLTGLARGYRFYHDTMLSNVEFEAILSQARAAYAIARESLKGAPADIMPALSYAALVPVYLRKMGAPFDPLTGTLSFSPLRKQLVLAKAVLRGGV